jgi:hypothetical protein
MNRQVEIFGLGELSFFDKKISQWEKFTSDIDMNQSIVHVYPLQNQ